MSPILGQFLENKKYLAVADYSQRKIYQLKPELSEVEAIITQPCHPDALTYDPSTNSLYVTCAEYTYKRNYYHIRKTKFDGTIDEVIYNVTQGKKERLASLLYSCTRDAVFSEVHDQ